MATTGFNPGLVGGISQEKLRELIRQSGGDTSEDISRLFDDPDSGARSGESPRERETVNDFGGLDFNRPDYSNPTPYIDVDPGGGDFGPDGEVPSAPNVTQRQPQMADGGQPTGPQAAPAQPRTPSPVAARGVLPFKPMGQAGSSPGVTPRMNNLYGSLGGLKGGGLGLPLDPLSNQTSDPIEGLIQLLRKGAI